MHSVEDNREGGYIVEQLLEMFNRLLLGKIQTELSKDLLVHVSMLDMRDVRVDHEGHQIENKARVLPENRKGCETELLEASIVYRLDATHGVDHFLAYFHWRGKGFRISSKNVSEIDYQATSERRE